MNDILFRIFGEISDGIIATDADGVILYMNATASQLTGWQPDEAKGRLLDTVFDAVNETTGMKIQNPVNEVIRTGQASEMSNHTILKQPSGDATTIERCGIPIKDDEDEIIGAVLVLRKCSKNNEEKSDYNVPSFTMRLVAELQSLIASISGEIKLFKNAGWSGSGKLTALDEMLSKSNYLVKLMADNYKHNKVNRGSGLQTSNINVSPKIDRLPGQRPEHILVMDDDEMLRDLATRCLTRLGYQVTTVANGEEAVHVYRYSFGVQTFDAVIVDLTIKDGMGGLQTVEELKKINPHIKAIITSGYINDPILQQYKLYGFCDAICKPYGLYELDRVLQKTLNQN